MFVGIEFEHVNRLKIEIGPTRSPDGPGRVLVPIRYDEVAQVVKIGWRGLGGVQKRHTPTGP
jgi:hypothetical protein